MNIMSAIEDQKKIMFNKIKVAQLISYITNFDVKKKAIELILQGLDLNLIIADTNFYNNKYYIGDSLLHLARKENDMELFNNLMCNNIKDKKGNTVLHEAFHHWIKQTLEFNLSYCKNSFIDLIFSEHIKNRDANNPAGSDGVTHFHIACATNHIEAIQFFLSNGISVNQTVIGASPSEFFEGYTPLHFAVYFGHVKVIKILLAYGANIELKDAKGKTPLHVSLERNIELMDYTKQVCLPANIEIIKEIIILLLKYNISSNLRLYAVSAIQSLFEIESLVVQGINVNQSLSMDAQVWPGYSALHFAAHFNVNTVKLLIDLGANIEAKDANEVTPFDMCIDRYKVEDICDILCLVSSWKNIVMSDAQTKLVDLLFALRNLDTIQQFLQKSTENVKLFVPFDSPLWPGFTVLHVTILLTERNKCKTDYKYNDKVIFYPDFTILTECLKQDADVTVKDNRNWTPIHFAFRLEKPNCVDLLLQYHHKIENSVDDQNLSHLHIACAAKNQYLVKKLLWNGADVNTVYKGDSPVSSVVYPGWTPLHIAVHKRDHEIVKLLLKFGADVHALDAVGFTPIHILPHRKHSKELSQSLFNTPNLRDFVVKDLGLSYLHIACWTNNVDVVKQLLDSGSDVNKAITYENRENEYPGNNLILNNYNGNTPLHYALHNKSELVRLLIDRGADILIKNSFDRSPLKEILLFSKSELIDIVVAALKCNVELRKRVETETGVTMLHLACRKFDVNLVKELLDNGADVNAQTHENSMIWPKSTCLHLLLLRYVELTKDVYNVEVILKLLLIHNADVTLANANHNTPLHIVYHKFLIDHRDSYRTQLSLLLKAHKNFEVNPTSCEGFSHFHIACHILDTDVVEYFLDHGVDVNATIDPFATTDPFCFYKVAACTPLHLATRRINSNKIDLTLAEILAQLKIIDLLIKYGADVNAEDINGNTPAHNIGSCSSLKENPLQRLASSGANMNARNIHGETPLEIVLNKMAFTLGEVRHFIACGCQFNTFNTVTEKGYIAIANSVLSHEDMQLLLFGTFVNSPDLMKVDDMKRTAIHNVVSLNVSEASDTQYVDLFDISMKFGYDIDDQDNLGRTALHLAALFRNESAVEGLLLAGADVNITDDDGKTPFAYVFEPCVLCFKADKRNHDQYSHTELFKIFMRQIKKMEYCDIYLNESNGTLLNKALERFDADDIAHDLVDILPEMVQIMMFKVTPYSLSVADFVSNNAVAVTDYPTMSQAKRRAIDQFFRKNKESFQVQFENTAGILQLQYRQAKLRRKVINVAKASLAVLMRLHLPDICSHIILGLLKNFELQNLISSTARRATTNIN